MGTCLKCHKKIRDGQKYCDSCKQKRKNKAETKIILQMKQLMENYEAVHDNK